MLDTLRSASKSWLAKLLLGLLVLSFAVWGISGTMLTGVGANTVVAAGRTEVGITDYRLAYDRQIQVLSQRFGQRITREQATALGIDNQVLSQLVAGAVLDEQARLMRLGVSGDKLAALTAEDPAFHGPDGRFDRRQFDFVLRQVGMRPDDYLLTRQQVAIRQQIVEAVSDGMTAPDAFLRAVALYQGEDRTVEYVVVPASIVQPIGDPSEEELAAYFEENKASYRAPEYRAISYVTLDPESVADPAAISAEDVRADYDANRSRYTTPETRRIEQLAFADEAAARAAVEKVRSGASFEDIVADSGRSMNDVVLGTYSKGALPDQSIADAAFALEEGEVSDVVEGAFGPVVLRATEIQPEEVKPFEEAEPEIRRDLAIAEASRILLDLHDSYEDARAGGATLEEAARNLGLEVETVSAVDRSGRTPEGTILADLPESAELLKQAFETEVGLENPAIPIGNDGYVFYEVTGVEEARDRALDEVRDQVVEDWKSAQAETRLSERLAELRGRLQDGTSLDEIAEELSQDKQTKRGLSRDSDDSDFGEEGVGAVFSVARGETGVTRHASGDGRILFQVTEVFEPAGAGPDALDPNVRRNFAQGMADDLLDQLVARLQGEMEVTVNRTAINNALSF
ncbi:MAG: peptidyl-prolyl cis-trans isomerase [Rhizobiaceae bacterium]|nr:peptidyl-prolyl cis-trans isomerase [Rhizobiaceae bacterium]MCV0408608.1 peptidyl-prolyl cis-trans isomerase [Rhizobiaceae bacterium]